VKSLDYVQQPDGSFRWEMVELDESARTAAPAPAPQESKPTRTKRRTTTEETISQTAEYEF
jgi:hypothetical protein